MVPFCLDGDASCVAHEALQNAATGRWTTNHRGVVEKIEMLEKDGMFVVFFQDSQSFSGLKHLRKMEALEKDEAGKRDGGGRMRRLRATPRALRSEHVIERGERSWDLLIRGIGVIRGARLPGLPQLV